MKKLADELVERLKKELPNVLEPDDMGIWSVCICGSYPRGDFIEGNSDLDFNIYFKPGRKGSFPTHDASTEPGFKTIQELSNSILNGRPFYSHSPNGIDWIPLLWEWIPQKSEDIHIPEGPTNFRYFNLFLFDYLENLMVLWGNDPREIMPPPPDFHSLAIEWFEKTPKRYEIMKKEGVEWRIPFSVFVSIQVAQIVFGERTIDKRNLLELYKRNIPEFPMKDFGCRMITDKLNQRYPDAPCAFAPTTDYETFEKELCEVVMKSGGSG